MHLLHKKPLSILPDRLKFHHTLVAFWKAAFLGWVKQTEMSF